MLVVGTRPEAVKLAPVALALADDAGWKPIVISTGQHGAVVDEVLAAFAITADQRHEAWEHNGELATLHTVLVERLHADLQHHLADAVIVQGDTASALAGALAAFWLQIPSSTSRPAFAAAISPRPSRRKPTAGSSPRSHPFTSPRPQGRRQR